MRRSELGHSSMEKPCYIFSNCLVYKIELVAAIHFI